MKKYSILTSTACIAIFALATVTTSLAANVLVNPGFETDAVLNNPPVAGATGWTTFNGANTASANADATRSGIGSLQLPGGGGFSVPGAYQTFAASPGQLWDFQGYMLTSNTLPADATFGLLKIVWSDGVNDLAPGTVNIGVANFANPGIESRPLLNSGSTPNVWLFTEAQGIAPAGTTQVKLYALMVDQSAGTGYFDDLQATNNTVVVVGPQPINYPTNNAPTPTRPASSVKSMFNSSGTYTDATIDTWYTSWSGNPGGNGDYGITNPPSTTVTSTVKRYLGMGYAGVEFVTVPIDVTGFSTLHVDVWTPNANQFGIQLVSLDPNTQAGQVNFTPASGAITTNHWLSLDIPLSQFAAANGAVDLTNLKQLLWIDNQAGGGVVNGNFYIDNVYFWTTNQVKASIANGYEVSWAASSANTYQPQRSPNNSTWSNLGGPLSGGSAAFDPAPAAFYRVQEITPGSVQYAVNGGFETDNGGGGAAGWNIVGGTPTRINTDSHLGTWCMDLHAVGSTSSQGIQEGFLAITGGASYSFAAWSKLVSTAGLSFGSFCLIQWFDSGNAFISQNQVNLAGGPIGTWTQSTGSFAAPANATQAQIQVIANTGAVTGDFGEVHVDDVSLTTGGASTTNNIAATVQPGVGISWLSGAGLTYTVQSRPTVGQAVWSPLANVIGTGTNTYPDAVSGSSKFYRVLEDY